MKLAALTNKITRQYGVIRQLLVSYSRHNKTKRESLFAFLSSKSVGIRRLERPTPTSRT